jgi:hypothetical protein
MGEFCLIMNLLTGGTYKRVIVLEGVRIQSKKYLVKPQKKEGWCLQHINNAWESCTQIDLCEFGISKCN